MRRNYNNEVLANFIKDNDIKTADDLNNAFREMYQDVVQVMLENEMSNHLGFDKNSKAPKETSNRRNGYSDKKVRSTFGELLLSIPRDREDEFEPVVVEKHSRELSSDIENRIISMYAKGMSTRDISDHIKEIYGFDLSAESVSKITETIMEQAKEWQARPLDSVYPFLFLDAVHYSVRTNGKVVKRAAYVILGINLEGKKDVIGIYIGENETSKFWLQVLTDMKSRGVKDVLISSIDGLPGFSDAIKAVFPKAEVQRCIVHQIRNTLGNVPWKDRKSLAQDLKAIYNAPTEEQGFIELEKIEEKWGSKYSYALKSWRNNWSELSTFFKYTPEIRKIMYTTNIVESLHMQLRKVSKTKTVFPTDDSLVKILYLATIGVTKKWTIPVRDWVLILGQLQIHFEDRL
jgi:transposase-like protein